MNRYIVVLAEERSSIEALLTRAVLEKLEESNSIDLFRVARTEDDLWEKLDGNIAVLLLSSTFSNSPHNEFIQVILKKYPELKIISLSNRFGDRSSLTHGAFEVIDKPVRNPVLWAKMDKAFEAYDEFVNEKESNSLSLLPISEETEPNPIFELKIEENEPEEVDKNVGSEKSISLLHVEQRESINPVPKTYAIPNVQEPVAKKEEVTEQEKPKENKVPVEKTQEKWTRPVYDNGNPSIVVIDDEDDEDDEDDFSSYKKPSNKKSSKEVKPPVFKEQKNVLMDEEQFAPIVEEILPLQENQQNAFALKENVNPVYSEASHPVIEEKQEPGSDQVVYQDLSIPKDDVVEDVEEMALPFGLVEDTSLQIETETFNTVVETEDTSTEKTEVVISETKTSPRQAEEISTPAIEEMETREEIQEIPEVISKPVPKVVPITNARRIRLTTTKKNPKNEFPTKKEVPQEMVSVEKPSNDAVLEGIKPVSNNLEPEKEIIEETPMYDEKSEWIEANEGFVAKNGEFVSLVPPRSKLRNVEKLGADKGKKVEESSGDGGGLFSSVKSLFKK